MMRYGLHQHDLSATMAEPCGLAGYELHRPVFGATHNPLLRSATGLVEFALASALRARLTLGEGDFAAPKSGLYASLVQAVA